MLCAAQYFGSSATALRVMRDRRLAPAERAIRFRDAAVLGGDAVVRGDRLSDQIDRLFGPAGLQRDHPEEMQAVELARVGVEDAAIELLGFLQLSGLVTPERELVQSVDPRAVRRLARHPVTTGVSGRAPHSDQEPS